MLKVLENVSCLIGNSCPIVQGAIKKRGGGKSTRAEMVEARAAEVTSNNWSVHEEEGGGVRSGPGVARTILLFHIISARPSKQPLRGEYRSKQVYSES